MRPLGVISIPWLLVFIQPDLGTSLVFGALMLTMLYWSGMPINGIPRVNLLTALLSGQVPWAMAIWIPMMALVAYRSLPWKRLAATITVMVHGHGRGHTLASMHGLKDYQRDVWCCS